ncbi:hypothetical protein FM115_11525 [Marinilactibacillus psychrotolerans 42ea]|uniref:Uncharacterized protein n=1 Tax=Marinilactibacillus psychrotolerans 42ea TaxID=1255609 RepID=A0A1R4KNY1_9LACT|nr:hypothetical protein [Marinilactibacillus psychrotolerans]SJN46051.1 hypothetical protein FM115_11525 [Marinilactibacillus psychrotolerans 42ea]
MKNIQEHHMYVIDDKYFDRFKDPEMMWNKEEKRPYYYALKVKNQEDLYFLVPATSQVEKYQRIMKSRTADDKRNDMFHILKIGGRDNVLLLNKMIPVPAKYIKRAYTMNNIPLKVVRNQDIEEVNRKAKRIVNLTKSDQKIPYQPDIKKLLSEISKDLQQEKPISKETIETKEEPTIETPKKESPKNDQSPKM